MLHQIEKYFNGDTSLERLLLNSPNSTNYASNDNA